MGRYGDASWAASLAPPVRAGSNVATRNASRRRMERAIWGRRARTATGCGAGRGGGGFAPMSPLLVLIVAVLATSYAGPIGRFAAAPALAIAFWRLALVLPLTGGLAGGAGTRAQAAGRGGPGRPPPPAP